MMTPEEGFNALMRTRANASTVFQIDVVCECVYQDSANWPTRRERLRELGVYQRLDKVTTISEFEGLVAQLKVEVSDE